MKGFGWAYVYIIFDSYPIMVNVFPSTNTYISRNVFDRPYG